jgi:hypothetical protein
MRWHTDKSGAPCIKQKGVLLCIVADGANYRLRMDGTLGKREFETLIDAKITAFDLIDSGKAGAYLRRVGIRAADYHQAAIR